MNRKLVGIRMSRLHDSVNSLEKTAWELEKAVAPLETTRLPHTMKILCGITNAIRGYILKNEDKIIDLFLETEIENGKVKKDPSFQSEPEST